MVKMVKCALLLLFSLFHDFKIDIKCVTDILCCTHYCIVYTVCVV